jgi:hypothetical protein
MPNSMPIIHYKMLSTQGPVGSGVMASEYFAVQGVAKRATADHPFTVANEYVCGQLGRLLGLPIPPGFTVESGGTVYHVSMDFNLAGHALPPADEAALVAHDPDLASGIVIFDAWVLNPDRHHGNLAFDKTTKQVNLFDHSHAFLHGKDGPKYLEDHKATLFDGGAHCLAPHLPTLDGVRRWSERLRLVPKFFIEEMLQAATEVGLPSDRVAFCRDFLLDRAQEMEDLVRKHQGKFPKVTPDLWAQF